MHGIENRRAEMRGEWGDGKCSQCRKDLCKEEKVCYTGTRRRQRCRNKVIDPKKGDHYGRKYQRDKSPSG